MQWASSTAIKETVIFFMRVKKSSFCKRSGETYGYGPGMNALPEVMQLNNFTEVMFRAASKNVDPPMLSPVEGLVLPARLDPNGINYYNPDLPKPEFWNSNFRPDYFEWLLEQKKTLIKKLYYVDWLSLPEMSRATTVEVNQRTAESLRLLSPMLSRMEAEFLSPLISRTYALQMEHGMLRDMPIPEDIAGKEIVIEYISPIAQAQRYASAQNVLQAFGLALQLAQADPSVLMNYDMNAIVRDQSLNSYSLPSKYLRPEEEVQEMQAQQNQAQQAAAEAQTVETYSKAGKNISGAIGGITGG
jgi:hypothetical protein